ncbi:MAG: adenylate/guanylate cyclase domain-containing protein [Kouleothrix sp.]
MTALNSTGIHNPANLRQHLSPELYGLLEAGVPLPPAIVQAEVARLRAEVAAIATYIPSALVREQLAAPTPGRICGAYWNGSVLFADLSGFTALSGTLSALGKQGAEEVSAIINALFGALVDEIHRYRGGLLKFGGDALTAFFDAAVLDDDHARWPAAPPWRGRSACATLPHSRRAPAPFSCACASACIAGACSRPRSATPSISSWWSPAAISTAWRWPRRSPSLARW